MTSLTPPREIGAKCRECIQKEQPLKKKKKLEGNVEKLECQKWLGYYFSSGLTVNCEWVCEVNCYSQQTTRLAQKLSRKRKMKRVGAKFSFFSPSRSWVKYSWKGSKRIRGQWGSIFARFPVSEILGWIVIFHKEITSQMANNHSKHPKVSELISRGLNVNNRSQRKSPNEWWAQSVLCLPSTYSRNHWLVRS